MRWPWRRDVEDDRAVLDRLRNDLKALDGEVAGHDRVDSGLLRARLQELVDGARPPFSRSGSGHMGGVRVAVGGTEFLVAGSCSCGWRAALPEGALWPLCPNCGVQVMPPSTCENRLGYVAELLPEQAAVRKVQG